MEGWVSIHRQIMDHWIYKERKPFSRREAWFDLILLANHCDATFPLGNEIIEAKRGDVITSEVKLMDRWMWSKTKLRAFLLLLECNQMIAKKSDRKKTTITLINYGNFQDSQTIEKPIKNHEETTERLQKDTINNVNNDNNEKKKKEKELYPEDSSYFRMAVYLYEKICEWTDKVKEPDFQKWADDCRKLIDLDKRDETTVKDVIDWATKDDFWQQNILCPATLRKKFETLAVKMDKASKPWINNVVQYPRKDGKQKPQIPVAKSGQGQTVSDERMKELLAEAAELDAKFNNREVQ